jgi:3-oxoacyl-[acyl-carrier protein] reductase
MESLSGKVALVTGASRGIGRRIAEQLAARGARVAVNYVSRADAADEVVAGIIALGGEAIALRGDVSRAAEAEALVGEVVQAFGELQILVNNAGIARDRLILRMTEADWDAVLDTNVKGAFLCTKAALRPMMKARWGRIVNISSIVWATGNVGQANYSAAKSALVSLTRTTALEMASRGITANAVAPGLIATDMAAELGESRNAQAVQRIPVGRLGQPEDIAAAVQFFVSDAAAYVTGQVINVDGGLSISLW